MRCKERLNQVVSISGVSGAGKDHLIKEAVARGEVPPQVRVTSLGSELLEYFVSRYAHVKNRDDLKELPAKDIQQAVGELAPQVLRQPTLLNAHMVTYQEGQPVVFADFYRQIRPLSFLYVWTDPEQILKQRKSDGSRKRVDQDVYEVADIQELSLDVTARLAREMGSKLVTLWNREDNVAENAAIIGDLARELRK